MKIVYEQKLKDSGVNASLEFRFSFYIFSEIKSSNNGATMSWGTVKIS